MTISQRVHAQVALIVFLVAGLAAAAWVVAPAKAAGSLIAIATMAAIWLVVAVIGSLRPFAEQSASERNFLTSSVAAAGLVLVISLGDKLALSLGYGGDALDRGVGVLVGIVLLVVGNTLPKVLSPLTAKRCAPSQVQSIQRLAGWTFALAGLVCIAAWIFLPVKTAADWQEYAAGTALAIVIARYAWAFMAPSAPRSSSTTES